jgi:hypothetical protein
MFKMLFGDFPFKSNTCLIKVSIWSMKLTPNAIRDLILRKLRSNITPLFLNRFSTI